MVLKLLQLEHLLNDETITSQPDTHCDPGSYLSPTSSIPLVPHSPPASNSTEQKPETSSLWNAGFNRHEPETSFDLFNNPLDVSADKTPHVLSQSKENSDKRNSGRSTNFEMEEAQNDVLSNQLGSVLKKTIENRLNLSSSHFHPASSSGTGGVLGSADNPKEEGSKDRLLSGLDEADMKARLTFTTKNKGKQRKKCASKLKGMMQQTRETTLTNMTECEKQKSKTVVSREENEKASSLSGKVKQLYSDYGRTKNKRKEKTSCENSFDENINEQNKNNESTESTHEISMNESELFNKVQPDEKKKALVPTCARQEKSLLSSCTISKLMKFAFDDSRISNNSTSSASESSENLNKSNISNTVHPPVALAPNPPSSAAEPILSSLDSSIFSKSNETANLSTTDLLSGHKWHTLPVNDQNTVSQVQDSSYLEGIDSVQTTSSPTVNAAKIFTGLKDKEQKGPPRVIQDRGLNTSPISFNNPINFTLPSQAGFSASCIHVSTPISAAHKTAAAATVTKRSSSMFEFDEDDLDLDFDVGFLQSDPKRTRLK